MYESGKVSIRRLTVGKVRLQCPVDLTAAVLQKHAAMDISNIHPETNFIELYQLGPEAIWEHFNILSCTTTVHGITSCTFLHRWGLGYKWDIFTSVLLTNIVEARHNLASSSVGSHASHGNTASKAGYKLLRPVASNLLAGDGVMANYGTVSVGCIYGREMLC